MIVNYVYKKSFLHSLDPRSKILFFLSAAFLAYIINSGLAIIVLYMIIILSSIISFIPPSRILKVNLKWGIFLFIISFIIIFWETQSLGLVLTKSFLITLRWLIVIQIAIIFVYTTNPQDLIVALTRLKVPKSLSFSIGIGFKVLPDIIEKARGILIAQRSRGLETKVKITNFYKLPIIIAPLFVPIIFYVVNFIDKTDLILDLRGFDLEEYFFNPFVKIRILDFVFSTCCLAILILIFLFKI